MEIGLNGQILIVDDSQLNLEVLKDFADENDYQSILCSNGKEAMDKLESVTPDLILLDVTMPDISGFELCKIIKQSKKFVDIPVIFITARTQVEDVVKGFQVGGVDYITKPFNLTELKVRMQTHLDLKRSRDDSKIAYETISIKNEKLERLTKYFKIMSITDSLTGLFNRRYIMQKILDASSAYEKESLEFSIIIADIDKFKKINDTYGHDFGDIVLTGVSKAFMVNKGDANVVARWGGEEFLLLVNNADVQKAEEVAENLRKSVEKIKFSPQEGIFFNTSLSFGVAQFKDFLNVNETIKAADLALYEAKSAHGNVVIISKGIEAKS